MAAPFSHANQEYDVTIFEGLLMAHLLGDWLLQTEWQVLNKAKNVRALATHVAIYHAVVLVVLLFGFSLRFVPVIAVVVALGVLHAILDRRAPVKGLMNVLRLTVTREQDQWLAVVVDQAIHLLSLGVVSLILSATAVR
jgi:hypothetical protein